MKRKAISKKIRFEVFKRDFFSCQYCGATPPPVILEIDHIEAVSNGGDNHIDNLVTACFDCNRGKSNIPLNAVPTPLIEKSKVAAEKEEQLAGLKKLKTAIKRRVTKDINSIESVFQEYFDGLCFSNKFKETIRIRFLPKLDSESLKDHMSIACNKIDDPNRAIRYFCGINWNIIKKDEEL